MAVYRVNKTRDYTTIGNYHLKEKEMSLKAKGLLTLFLSLPENWNYSAKGLTTLTKESKNTINATMNELEKFGYLKRTRIYENGKVINWQYDIYEKPEENLHPKNLDIENEDIKNLDIENWDDYIITKQLNTNKLSTNKTIICRVVERLNELAGTSYKPTTKNTIELINGRLSEGYTEQDLITVVEKMCYLWNKEPAKNEKDMRPFLRPSTLFRPSNFENYLNMQVTKKEITTKDLAKNYDWSDF